MLTLRLGDTYSLAPLLKAWASSNFLYYKVSWKYYGKYHPASPTDSHHFSRRSLLKAEQSDLSQCNQVHQSSAGSFMHQYWLGLGLSDMIQFPRNKLCQVLHDKFHQPATKLLLNKFVEFEKHPDSKHGFPTLPFCPLLSPNATAWSFGSFVSGVAFRPYNVFLTR